MQIVSKNLSYVYGEKSKALSFSALNGVDLTVNEGDFFAIIGQTGSGKSTFVQHINGLIKLEKNRGSLTVGEFDLSDKKCDFKKLRSKAGMVFQYPEYQLFAETVFEDVAFGLKNFFPELSAEQVERRVEEAVTTVGLNYSEVKDKSPFELSGGQKRRVAIAGVIVTKPEVLILDEPVAGLDPVGKREFTALLKKLHSDFVKTIIIVSHDMDFVAENCNKVAVFSKGRVVACGTPREVFADKNRLFSLGLDLPVTAYLTEVLHKAGKEINSDLTVASFVDEVVRLYKKKDKLTVNAEKGENS